MLFLLLVSAIAFVKIPRRNAFSTKPPGPKCLKQSEYTATYFKFNHYCAMCESLESTIATLSARLATVPCSDVSSIIQLPLFFYSPHVIMYKATTTTLTTTTIMTITA